MNMVIVKIKITVSTEFESWAVLAKKMPGLGCATLGFRAGYSCWYHHKGPMFESHFW